MTIPSTPEHHRSAEQPAVNLDQLSAYIVPELGRSILAMDDTRREIVHGRLVDMWNRLHEGGTDEARDNRVHEDMRQLGRELKLTDDQTLFRIIHLRALDWKDRDEPNHLNGELLHIVGMRTSLDTLFRMPQRVINPKGFVRGPLAVKYPLLARAMDRAHIS